jgi:spermidine synthase
VEKNYLYFHDKFGRYEEHVHSIERILYEERTPYQLLQLVESPVFGKMLIIDGDVQSSLKDEYIYHESLVHPAMLITNNPKTIVILGGGEGATAREILKHRSVVRVVMIDIDKDAIAVAKKYLKEWHRGAFDDKRLVLVHSEARKFMESEVSPSSVDVIISDLTEPFEEGPSYKLSTKEFYSLLYSKLKDDGVLALQSSLLRVTNFKMHAAIKNTLQGVFPIVRSYITYIPSFDTMWSFIIASKMADPANLSKERINELISNRIEGELKFYDGTAHVGMFSIPKDLLSLLSSVSDVITDEHLLTLPRK